MLSELWQVVWDVTVVLIVLAYGCALFWVVCCFKGGVRWVIRSAVLTAGVGFLANLTWLLSLWVSRLAGLA